jgi:hypothetical protein
MTHVESIRQGAAAVRRTSKKNIMEMLVGIIDAHPSYDLERRFREWSSAIQADDDCLEAALRHTYTNLNAALEAQNRRSVPVQRPARRSKEEVAASTAEMKERARASLVLDLVMPNGKSLRDCTGAYARKCGGVISKIAAKVKPGQLVGQAITEKQAQQIWKKG